MAFAAHLVATKTLYDNENEKLVQCYMEISIAFLIPGTPS